MIALSGPTVARKTTSDDDSALEKIEASFGRYRVEDMVDDGTYRVASPAAHVQRRALSQEALRPFT